VIKEGAISCLTGATATEGLLKGLLCLEETYNIGNSEVIGRFAYLSRREARPCGGASDCEGSVLFVDSVFTASWFGFVISTIPSMDQLLLGDTFPELTGRIVHRASLFCYILAYLVHLS
jgi:hypothetical protein